MATPEPVTSSPRLVQAASAERGGLESELTRAEQEAPRLGERAEEAEQRAATIRQRLKLLDQLGTAEAGVPARRSRPRLVPPDSGPANGWLRGATIRQTA